MIDAHSDPRGKKNQLVELSPIINVTTGQMQGSVELSSHRKFDNWTNIRGSIELSPSYYINYTCLFAFFIPSDFHHFFKFLHARYTLGT